MEEPEYRHQNTTSLLLALPINGPDFWNLPHVCVCPPGYCPPGWVLQNPNPAFSNSDRNLSMSLTISSRVGTKGPHCGCGPQVRMV